DFPPLTFMPADAGFRAPRVVDSTPLTISVMPFVPVSRMIPVGPVFPVRTGRSVLSVFLMIPVAPVFPGLRVAAVLRPLDPFFIIVGLQKSIIFRNFRPIGRGNRWPRHGFFPSLRYFCTHFRNLCQDNSKRYAIGSSPFRTPNRSPRP